MLCALCAAARRPNLTLVATSVRPSVRPSVTQVGAAVVLFINSEALGDMVDELDDEDAARFTQNLGMTGLSKTEVRGCCCCRCHCAARVLRSSSCTGRASPHTRHTSVAL